MPISDTQRQIQVAAAQQEARLAVPPASLPAGARNVVIRSMLKNSLIAKGAAPDEPTDFTWRHDDAGAAIALQITDVGWPPSLAGLRMRSRRLRRSRTLPEPPWRPR
ncbi:hypothetical protein GCM10011504_53970 [Siccirubricoccus deserti]|uniref:Uncharacterized protein n=1 Tax=Siccirubricoccus deserti TaxID=2013562 RepID=A0A9X0R4U0_9PROT|nr:hypothetical protein [Siccirubricoccus deserti]MBC4018893.1 hypothetical protein [Siccirubricoccus deserti]GGC69292.1 hypothetical protein GCM10011504_53970 [Siccirubricoccus deserti]